MGKANLKKSILEGFTMLDRLHLPVQIDAPIFSIFSCLNGELYGTHQLGFLAM